MTTANEIEQFLREEQEKIDRAQVLRAKLDRCIPFVSLSWWRCIDELNKVVKSFRMDEITKFLP